jgi:hypothetical protein
MRICTVTAAFNYQTKAAAVRDELEGKYIHKVNASGFFNFVYPALPSQCICATGALKHSSRSDCILERPISNRI